MLTLLQIELGKIFRLASVRFSLLLLILLPVLWAYAPGIFDVYGVFLVSGFQVPALSLLSGMEFLFPLLVAIISSELLGSEISLGTLRATLLRPVTRANWLLAKVSVVSLLPFMLLLFVLLVSLAAGLLYGFGSFVGGTGLGAGGLVGQGITGAGQAWSEILRAYLVAAYSLIPVSLLALLLTLVFMNAASGALATLGILILSSLLVVFSWLSTYLPTTQLNAYLAVNQPLVTSLILTAVYAVALALTAVAVVERKDF